MVSPRAAALTLDRLAAETGGDRVSVPRWWPLAGKYGRAFTAVVDDGCHRAGRTHWVEKSPGHLHCLDAIARWVPEARVVHVVRQGSDVVASLIERCREEPERWVPQLILGWRPGPIPDDGTLTSAAVARWNADIRRSLACRSEAGHTIVDYHRLVRDPTAALRPVCDLLGVEVDAGMLRWWEAAETVVGWRRRFDHMQGAFEHELRETRGRLDAVVGAALAEHARGELVGRGDVTELLAQPGPVRGGSPERPE
jgi:hypothetical protein